ncbi:hypothetical protein F5B22DRAFT_218913 [Xylaria bambusicola]|uniref:uncharacterized protein n=1 Tax=Xylaria bambusicola TaxID=326684 RepID=UPI002007EDB3|nr:uncharacterized protein F5B22DRAFT_218913 [Xylaria bambusicola]KAI0514820.1 hypothetical protein F5B22DRAFT_218913 [Xylaria bambusicola]
MQPSMRLRVAAGVPHPVTPMIPKGGAVASKILLPTVAWLGAAGLVGLYVSKQLHQRSVGFDDIFAQQNTPEVEEARKKGLLVDQFGDPRNSLLNVLGWTK